MVEVGKELIGFTARLLRREDLSRAEAAALLDALLDPAATDAQIAGTLVALASKGATVEELTGLASAMRERATPIGSQHPCFIDTAGTGSSRAKTFNIGTAAAFVIAGLFVSLTPSRGEADSSCSTADSCGRHVTCPTGFSTTNLVQGSYCSRQVGPSSEAPTCGFWNMRNDGTWVAAADDRVKAVVPVAGIVDLHAYLNEGMPGRFQTGVIAGHCDCMFFVNTHRWDFPLAAALIAPRPLLLGNSDADDIFPVPGYRRLADKVRKVYALYGAEEKFQLLETKGPHRDTPELRVGINKWMNRWLKRDTSAKVTDDLPPKLKPQDLRVLAKKPEDERNTAIHEFLIRPAAPELPKAPKVTPLARKFARAASATMRRPRKTDPVRASLGAPAAVAMDASANASIGAASDAEPDSTPDATPDGEMGVPTATERPTSRASKAIAPPAPGSPDPPRL